MDRPLLAIFLLPQRAIDRLRELPNELLVIGTTPEAMIHAKALMVDDYRQVPPKSLAWGCGYLWNSIRDEDHTFARMLFDPLYSTLVYLLARDIDELFENGKVQYDSPILEARLLLGKLPDPNKNYEIDAEVIRHSESITKYGESIIRFYHHGSRENLRADLDAMKRLNTLARKMYDVQ